MRGILFKPDMIKAIKEGRKTQTRRVIKFPQLSNIKDFDWHAPWFDSNLGKWVFSARFGMAARGAWIKSHYQVGGVVYIKEVWATENKYNHLKPSEIPRTAKIFYLLDGHYDPFMIGRVRSPLFMMEWMARYFRQITDVRPERLQEITWEDCLAEGIVHTEQWQKVNYQAPEPLHPEDLSNEEADKEIGRGWIEYARQAYAQLWDSINPKYPWASNDWVFVYTFKEVEK